MFDWQALLEAVVLGIVQGLTEFLPISSSAHLRIVPELFGWKDRGAGFTAIIQIGTLVAVLIYFRNDIVRIAAGFFTGLWKLQPFATLEARQGWMMIIATIPIVVFGLLLKSYIENEFRSLYVISGTMIGLAILLAIADWRLRLLQRTRDLRSLEQLGWTDAILVGLAQALALVPGSSRSGVTMTAGMFLEMDRATAARFSFLLSLPSVLAAGLYQLYKERAVIQSSSSEWMPLLVATVVSGIVGYASIAWMLRYLRTRSTLVFIVYRIALGLLLLGLLFTGVLQPLPPSLP